MGMVSYKDLFFKEKYKNKIKIKTLEKSRAKSIPFRGRMLQGVIKSIKMQKTIIVKINYLKKLKKYNRFIKKRSSIPAHYNPIMNEEIKKGDFAIIAECKPISKTKKFQVLKIISKKSVNNN